MWVGRPLFPGDLAYLPRLPDRSKMTDIRTKTIFAIHSTFPFIHDPKNERFLVDNERILEDEPDDATVTDDEDATPAPTEAMSRPFLRITTDDFPKVPSEGFVFGRDPVTSDILLETCANNGVSRKQFALQVVVHDGEGSFLLKNFGRHGTTVSSAGDNRRIKHQKAITPDQREFTIYIGDIQIRFEFFDHSQHGDSWRERWRAYCLKYDHAPSPSPSAHPPLSPPPPPSSPSTPWRQDFQPVSIVGGGAQGHVYRATHSTTAHTYAVKQWHRRAGTNFEDQFFENLLKVKHEYIITYFQRRTKPLAIVMEFVGGGDLRAAHKEERLSSIEFKTCVIQITSALDYLHQFPIVHRDLKPDNVMVASRRPIHIKLCDFGMASSKISSMRTFCGTYTYCAPEVETGNYSTKVDMWSLGVMIHYFCYGLPRPRQGRTLSSTLRLWHQALRQSKENILKEYSTEGPAGLMSRLLTSQQNRPDARTMLMDCENISWDAPRLANPSEAAHLNKYSGEVSESQDSQVVTIGPNSKGHVDLFGRRKKR
ncbi:kinase-like domain-containing protein [Xylaria arbuscula]|nr:kinase-like domain-containing protein [Xylaria arbuscula]